MVKSTYFDSNGKFVVPPPSVSGVEKAPSEPQIGPEIALSSPESGLNPVSAEPAREPSCRVVLRVSPAGLEWAHSVAERSQLDLSSLIWQLLIRQAEQSGVYMAAPSRYRRRSHPNRRPRPQVI